MESGKNISEGWIGVECPFCPDLDPSTHLGINPETNMMNCWRCGTKGSVLQLVRYHHKCSFSAAEKIASRFTRQIDHVDTEHRKNQALEKQSQRVLLPSESTKTLLPAHRSFLLKRGFEPDLIFRKYDLSCIDRIGKWKFRLVIPIIMNNRLVAWTTRDITGLSDRPYKNAPKVECAIPIKSCLYNIDTVKDSVIVTEGPLDVWTLGEATVCTFGIKYTRSQVHLLTRKAKKAHILFDSDAIVEASALAFDLSAHMQHVEVLELESGDPADMNEQDVRALRREIFGKIF
jgi:DNA primase